MFESFINKEGEEQEYTSLQPLGFDDFKIGNELIELRDEFKDEYFTSAEDDFYNDTWIPAWFADEMETRRIGWRECLVYEEGDSNFVKQIEKDFELGWNTILGMDD